MKRANGTGTVYRLKGRRRRPWIAQRGRVTIGYYETKKDALLALDKLTGRVVTEKYNMTFAEVYDSWLAERRPHLGESSLIHYQWAYDKVPMLHKKKFRDLRTADFQAAIDQAGFEHASSYQLKVLFKQLTKWAIREEVAITDFSVYVSLPAAAHSEKPIFSDMDIAKLKKCDTEPSRAILCMIYTGMRISELLDLTVSACHGDYVIGGEKTEAGKNRVIPIPECVRGYFDDFIAQAGGGHLIPWTQGTFRKYYKQTLADLGIEYIPPHSCRHTFASICRRTGVDPETLQKIMGHRNYQTTANVYVHKERQELIAAVKNL